MDVNKNDSDNIKYIIKFLRRKIVVVTKEFLKSRNMPDTGSILIHSEYYINE